MRDEELIDFSYEPNGLSGNPFDQLDGYDAVDSLDGLFSSIKKLGRKIDKGRRKLGRSIDKGRRNIGRAIDKNVTQPVVKSTVGKIALGVAGAAFLGPMAISALKGTKLASLATKVGTSLSKSALVKKGVNYAVTQAVSKQLAPKIPTMALDQQIPDDLKNDPAFLEFMRTGKMPAPTNVQRIQPAPTQPIKPSIVLTAEQRRRLPSHVRRQIQSANVRAFGGGAPIRRAVGTAVRETGARPSPDIIKGVMERVLPHYVKNNAPALAQRTQDLTRAAKDVAEISAVVKNAPPHIQAVLSSVESNARKIGNNVHFNEIVNDLKSRGLSQDQIMKLWGQSEAFKVTAVPKVAEVIYPTIRDDFRRQGYPPRIADLEARGAAMDEAEKAVEQTANGGAGNLLALGIPLALVLLS